MRTLLPACLFFAAALGAADPLYEIEQTVAQRGFEGKTCWVHARAGAIPPRTGGNESDAPFAVMTLQRLDLAGSDLFHPIHTMTSADRGATWSTPVESAAFPRKPFSWNGRDDYETTVCDFWPKWHAASGKMLGIGHAAVYDNGAVAKVRPRATLYSVYDAVSGEWSPWETMAMPDDPKFGNAGAGCVQRVDLADGTVLLPIYFKPLEAQRYSVTVVRASFDGTELRYLDHGSELTVPIGRGLYEPSLALWQGRYYLTLRNDESGYVSVSEDGRTFSDPVPWRWDDGSDLGNYNTQQHWVTHRDALFLVYTRRGAGNDHVFRHRAPLFIARVDPATLRVVRAGEQIAVPEHGARLGNFGVTEVDENETWITVTEWMQAPGPNYSDPAPLVARGADNRVWVSKLKWKTPNR